MSLRDHFVDVQVFAVLEAAREPLTIDEIAGRCVIESGPSRFAMPAKLARDSVRRLITGGNVGEDGHRKGARKLYRVDLGGKRVLPVGYLYGRSGSGSLDRPPYDVIATPFNRITGGHLTFVLDRNPAGDRVRVHVAGSSAIAEAERKARANGFDFEKKDDSFGYIAGPLERVAELAAFISRTGI